jgi:acetyl-CoA C-acetyltransferase
MTKWARGVSIIGAGYTTFGNVLVTPEIKGMTYRELLSWAALEALESAGITPKDVDSLVVAHYQTEPVKTHSMHAVAAEWLGLKEKPSIRYETACASGASGVRLAGSLVASGIDDIVLLVGAEVVNSAIDEKPLEYRKQPAVRRPLNPMDQFDFVSGGFDQAYFQPIAFDMVAGLSSFAVLAYAKRYGLTVQQMDEAQSAAAVNLRRNAAKNPKAYQRTEYADIARKAGFDDVMEFMRSRFNPWVSWPVRTCHVYTVADGAAALVLCPAEDARRYTPRPVDVVGVGTSAGLPYHRDPLDMPAEQAALRQAFDMASLKPEEIEYLGVHDSTVHQNITVAEMTGYLEPGQAWRAMIEGRTAFDGDKPMNTHGGCTSMGNAYGASGIAEIGEAVLQMRGECGERQIDPPPKVAVTHALGSGPSFGVTVLGSRE